MVRRSAHVSGCGVRSAECGVRRAECVLRDSFFGIRNSLFGMDSFTARENRWETGMEPARRIQDSRFRIHDAEDPWDSRARAHSEFGILNPSFGMDSFTAAERPGTSGPARR